MTSSRSKPSQGIFFVFFSDGILDARDFAGELFGRKRVEEIVSRQCQNSADEVVQSIFQAVTDHTGGAESFDDETIVVIKVKSGSGKKK